MSDGTTLTVRPSSQIKDRLAELAWRTGRSRSFLAAEAVAAYAQRELATVAALERGRRADVRAGRVITHEEVAREAAAFVDTARMRT